MVSSGGGPSTSAPDLVQRFASLRLHQADGHRSPHKPLLVLLALGNLTSTGSSTITWSDAEKRLAELLADYGPPSTTGRAQSAAYPFTRLRSDGVWLLDRDVPMDNVGPLREAPIAGRLDPSIEKELKHRPGSVAAIARSLVEAHFPDTVAREVLVSVGLNPDLVYAGDPATPASPADRRRSASWPARILVAWDRKCAFCEFDGALGGASVGIEAAHVRWFNHDGPDDLDNGLALCALHHKLFDRGVLGLTADSTVRVSAAYTARTAAGEAIYGLHGRELRPRPGTPLPAAPHVEWHAREVFKGEALAA